MKTALSNMFKKKLKLDVSSHDFRHGKITDLSKQLSIKEVQSYIGHVDVRTTLRYVNVDQDQVLAKVARLSKYDKNGSGIA